MKTYSTLTALLLTFFLSAHLAAQDAPATTTFYVVRHADRAGEADELTEPGKQRARDLSELMKHLRIGAIYSTDTKRTRATAGPTAKALELETTLYGDLTEDWFNKMKTDHQGKAVLIVGHSNTSGEIVKGFGGQGDFTIEHDEYDSLFVVSIAGESVSAMRLRFGEVTVEHE